MNKQRRINNKQIEKAVEELKTKIAILVQKTTDYGEMTDWSKDISLYQTLLSLAQLFLSVKGYGR